MFHDEDDPVLVQLVKHPFVWSGVGLLIRYAGDPSSKASFWKTLGAVSLAIGVGHTIARQPAVQEKLLR